jgi:hypothetical protein
MIVFNNEHFKGHSSRPGSSVDADNLYKTFTKLGFSVTCHHNQTRDQMIHILKKGMYVFNAVILMPIYIVRALSVIYFMILTLKI